MARPRAVIVTRPTELEFLLERHGTRGQAAFYLSSRGGKIDAVEERHHVTMAAVSRTLSALPLSFRRARVGRRDLDRFLFEPDDVVFAVGQDGLVANVAKYLAGQPVVGINPSKSLFDGVLVRCSPDDVPRLIDEVERGALRVEQRSMAEARTASGHTLLALNELFVGHVSHQSARYVLELGERRERQSSSGLIVSTGTGATGWASSVVRGRVSSVKLPKPTSPELVFFVREAFASVSTGTAITDGVITEGGTLAVRSEMDDGVVFGDGIEKDRLPLAYGEVVTIVRAKLSLALAA